MGEPKHVCKAQANTTTQEIPLQDSIKKNWHHTKIKAIKSILTKLSNAVTSLNVDKSRLFLLLSSLSGIIRWTLSPWNRYKINETQSACLYYFFVCLNNVQKSLFLSRTCSRQSVSILWYFILFKSSIILFILKKCTFFFYSLNLFPAAE